MPQLQASLLRPTAPEVIDSALPTGEAKDVPLSVGAQDFCITSFFGRIWKSEAIKHLELLFSSSTPVMNIYSCPVIGGSIQTLQERFSKLGILLLCFSWEDASNYSNEMQGKDDLGADTVLRNGIVLGGSQWCVRIHTR